MQRKNAVVDLSTYRVDDAPGAEDGDDWTQNLPSGTELLLGQYRITGYLNCGGFGITYLAKDSLDRTVVVKECFPSDMCYRSGKAMTVRTPKYRDELASVVRQFVGEAHRLANLSHSNIVHVHQIFEENDTAYIAMDFIDGPDLLDIIEDDPERFSPKEIIALTQKMLRAVKYLHERGMLHRDISPDNILIGGDGEPVLIDFGAARDRVRASRRALSKLKFVKDGYSPQEFYLAGSEQGAWSDLYSLAASLYHLISGEVPADGQARIASLATRKPDPYVPLAGRVHGYPARFLKALDKAMAVLPQNRVQSADEWLDMISGGVSRDLVRSRPVTAAVDLYARMPASSTALRAGFGKGGVAAMSVVACFVIAGVAAWPLIPTAPDVAGAGGTPLAAATTATEATGIAPPYFEVTVTLNAPRATTMPRLPEIAGQPPRVSRPDVLPAANAPATGPAQVRAPESPTAPGTSLATSAPSPLGAAPHLSRRPDIPTATFSRPVAFRAPAPPDRSSLPPGPRTGVSGNPVAASQWDVRIPFDEEPVRANGANTIRIAKVSPLADLAISGDWIASGVEVNAVNGVPLQPDMTLGDHFLSALAADADGYARASVRYRDPTTGRSSQGTLAVQVVRETLLADGTVLVTGKENRSWITRVETAGVGSGLREGDILIGEVFTSTVFNDHEDIAQAIAALSRNGVESAGFTVLRDGKRQVVGWSLTPG